MSRLAARLSVLPRALHARLVQRRQPPDRVHRVLIAHHLLLGDTLMLTPLLAKLRERHPRARVAMTVPKAIVPLYEHRPYGVVPIAYDPRDPATLGALYAESGIDLALVPGDNRFAWLALACGAAWIRAFAGDRPAYKNWPVDEAMPYPDTPAAWGDMVAGLVEGPPPRPYRRGDWPAPGRPGVDAPDHDRYAVLHVGASTPLKLWEPAKWRALADALRERGLLPVFSGGRGEEAIVAEIDRERRYASYAGRLSLVHMWHLLANARLLVAPDTGIAHLGRIVGVPTVALFGPGSAIVSGGGSFWRDSPFRAVTVPDFPCRDQRVLFRRRIEWVRRCGRGPDQCASPRCMHAIDLAMVLRAIDELLPGNPA